MNRGFEVINLFTLETIYSPEEIKISKFSAVSHKHKEFIVAYSTPTSRILRYSYDLEILNVEDDEFGREIFNSFPNPAYDLLNISNLPLDFQGKIELYDLNYNLLSEKYFKGENIQLNIQNFSIGTYFIKIISNNGDIFYKKFLKYN